MKFIFLFLKYYGSSPIACRIKRGQDKGKVETGIKYVKGNFLKGLQTNDLLLAAKELKLWNRNVCNVRVHGTTRKVPAEVFSSKEKVTLKRLPKTPSFLTAVSPLQNNRGGKPIDKGITYDIIQYIKKMRNSCCRRRTFFIRVVSCKPKMIATFLGVGNMNSTSVYCR